MDLKIAVTIVVNKQAYNKCEIHWTERFLKINLYQLPSRVNSSECNYILCGQQVFPYIAYLSHILSWRLKEVYQKMTEVNCR